MTTEPVVAKELPHGGTIRDLRISIGRLAQKGQDVFARTLLEGRTPGTPMDDATFELNHLAHGAAYHGFALAGVLRFLELTHGPDIAFEVAALVQLIGVDGDADGWCDDIADEIDPGHPAGPTPERTTTA